MPVRIDTSILDLHQEEVAALAHHKPELCALGDHPHHHKPPVCFVGDHVLLESKKELIKETLEPNAARTLS